MLQHSDSGITVNAAPARGEALDAVARPVAAFMGRARCGPVQHPLAIESYSEFERQFGGEWRDSTLATSVQQFFQHGGRRAIVVRIAPGASGGVLVLPTATAPLTLRARNPGSAERLRASVDLQQVSDDARFNLTVQRLDPRSGQIVDQEFFSDVSWRANDRRYLGSRLEHSRLVLPLKREPNARPLATPTDFLTGAIGYVSMQTSGSDGDALTDYDLIGAERHATGLFSLDSVEQIDFLYACGSPARPDAGAAFIVAAERYCASRNAMLVIDPPADCADTAALLGWRKRRPLASAHCFTYFPTVRHRERPTIGELPAAGALIGLLCRHDAQHHVFHALADDERQNSAALHRDWQPAHPLQPDDAMALLRQGVNPLIPGVQGRLLFPGIVTSANGQDRALGALPQQRLTKFILGQIDRGMRWAVFAEPGPDVWAEVQAQVGSLLTRLAEQGAFRSTDTSAGWSIQCDASTNAPLAEDTERVRMLLGFHGCRAQYPVMFSITLRRDGTSVTRTVLQNDPNAIQSSG